MPAQSCETGVVNWLVEPGTETYVPVEYAVCGPLKDDDGSVVVWGAGFGQPLKAAEATAEELHAQSGRRVVAIRSSLSHVARKASDVHGALDRFIEKVPYQVAEQFAPGRDEVLLGAHSLYGGAMALASGDPRCRALAMLATASMNNRSLGPTLWRREAAIFNRLVMRTFLQNCTDPAMYRTLAGGLGELGRLLVSGRLHPAFEHAFGDPTEDRVVASLADLTARGRPWRIFGGIAERCFPRREQEATVGRIGCQTEVYQDVEGPHACMDGRGRQQLVPVGQWLRDPK